MGEKLGICYCDSSGTMSMCAAQCFNEQETCDYFEKSSGDEKRCMHRNTCLKGHCDCAAAQAFYRAFGSIRTVEDVREEMLHEPEEEELNIEDFIEDEDEEPASCSNCMKHDQCHGLSGLGSGMDEEQKINIAQNCKAYSATPVWAQKQKKLPF